MAVSHRGAISFGMVHIPVGLYTATQDNDIHFNQLCKEDGSRVKYKKVCDRCGKEIGAEGEAFDSPEYLYELKLDGKRCVAYLDEGGMDLRNKRNLKMLPKIPDYNSRNCYNKNAEGRHQCH